MGGGIVGVQAKISLMLSMSLTAGYCANGSKSGPHVYLPK